MEESDNRRGITGNDPAIACMNFINKGTIGEAHRCNLNLTVHTSMYDRKTKQVLHISKIETNFSLEICKENGS
jgi:hypothetical protein